MIRAGSLTLDDLEALAFRYGGTLERNVATNTVRLVGALIDGRRVDLGPAPGPVAVSDGAQTLAARIGAGS